MKKSNQQRSNPRRSFLKQVVTGTAAMGMLSVPMQLSAAGEIFNPDISEADEWFKKVKGKHRIVFDVTAPHEIFPFAWPKVFLLTNEKTGSPAQDCTAVVVLRHSAIPYAMDNPIWEKYKFGEVFKVDDPATKAASVRNPFWQPKPGDFKVPGIGNVDIGINQLQESGVMFCVCDMALTVYSAVVAQGAGKDATEVKNDWITGLLPGVQVVPSGVWAVNRAQEHGCSYCFVG